VSTKTVGSGRTIQLDPGQGDSPTESPDPAIHPKPEKISI
jgi:hypothetical protein